MEHIFQEYRPEIVFHAAAYKHVPLMQTNAGEAVKNIALATRLLADMSHQHQVRSFVFISTDKAVNPASVMGSCKRIAEQYVQSLAAHSPCRFSTVRFGNVLDSQGSVVPIFREQIARGGPVTVTHPDMTRYFMTISEASQLVIQAGAMGKGGEIFVLDMGDPVRIMDLAADMIRLSGLRCGEDIELKIIGPRPGEKLHEELHSPGEGYLPTTHPKIHAVDSSQHDFHQVLDAMQQLERVASGRDQAVIAALQRLVPHLEIQPSRREDGRRIAA
jgi:FlaA1/EpsC-like NDP-sugar epimerase